MAFTQTMTVQTGSPEPLAELMEGWHRAQHGVAPGYQGARLLADRDHPDTYLIEVTFASAEEARRNDVRPDTEAWAEQLRALVHGEPEYRNYEVAFTTG